jgi:ribose-phosphate pyrophosphokinase
MQGFFGKPVDNLFAEPLIARWIQANVRDWRDGVVVSKNAGGTKRVTSLADALKLNFGIVTTDRRRNNMSASMMMDNSVLFDGPGGGYGPDPPSPDQEPEPDKPDEHRKPLSQRHRPTANGFPSPTSVPQRVFTSNIPSSPLVQSTRADSASPSRSQTRLTRATTAPTAPSPTSPTLEEGDDEYTDERAREVITARLMGGHVVDDDYPSPSISAMSGPPTANPADPLPDPFDNTPHDPMACSFESTASSFQPDHALGGTFDAAASSDEEDKGLKNPELEQTVTLVGQVREKVVFLVDDMIDKSASWIAAAETVVKRGGAKKVYCIGTHGLFGDESLEEMERCECIDFIVVTNSFPISKQKVKECKKLVVLDLATLLSEAIRRNHYGESISALFQLHD